jgi:hypothetical protein
MKKMLFCIILTIALTGCEKQVSQEEYDTLKVNYENLKSEHDNLKIDYNGLQDKNETMKNSLEEYMSQYAATLTENLDEDYVSAWGKSAFGENIQCGKINDDKTQLIIPITNVESESIQMIMNAMYDNIELLKFSFDLSSSIVIPKIYIKVIDANSSPVMEVFLDIQNSADVKMELLISSTYSEIVYDALNELQ